MSLVPSRIVIAGNSRMSLNERFSNIPKVRARSNPQNVRRVFRSSHQKKVPIRQEIIENIEYIPIQKPAKFRRPVKQIIHQIETIPIQNRLSYYRPPPNRFVNAPNFVNRRQVFQKNRVLNHNAPTKPNQNRFVGFKKLGNRPNFNNNRFNKPFQQQKYEKKQKTVAELDQELDAYMRKSKHTPISF